MHKFKVGDKVKCNIKQLVNFNYIYGHVTNINSIDSQIITIRFYNYNYITASDGHSLDIKYFELYVDSWTIWKKLNTEQSS